MAIVQESYGYKAMTASGALLGTRGGHLGGFLCTTAGSLKLDASTDGSGATIVDTFAVAVGVFYPLPFSFAPGSPGVYATLTGGAKGTFALV